MSKIPFEELAEEVIRLRRKYPQLHRTQAWKIVIDDYEQKHKRSGK